MAWFISDPTVLAILENIVALAGPNFNLPYDSTFQPTDGSSMLSDDLLQFKFLGGTQIQSVEPPAEVTSMGRAICGLISMVAPLISSYVMILPILGVIRGLIEIICAMMNPYAVIRAVIRLFRKWIPAFMTLFPPFAAILLIINIIKILLAIAFFILTVVVPIYELIKHNVTDLKNLIESKGDKQAQEAEKAKLEALVLELLNQIGLLNVIKPILDIIMSILSLSGGIPCKKRKKKNGPSDLTNVPPVIDTEDDETCCNDDVCPPVFLNPPKGQAVILPAVFSNAPPFFVWNIQTLSPGNENLSQLLPYVQNLQQQLNSQLDEPISVAQTAGGSGSATLSVTITSSRGKQSKTVPIISINGDNIVVMDFDLKNLMGVVQYEVAPNFDVLVANNIIGLGCHPDVSSARSSLDNFGDPEAPGIDNYPELNNIGLDKLIEDMNNVVNDVRDFTQPPFPPLKYDPVQILNDFIKNLKNILNSVLSKVTNPVNSLLDVNKNIVAAGNEDSAIISITARDSTGSLIARQLPSDVGIDVEIFTDFGTISDQILNSSTGIVTAHLKSFFSGTANITAKINGNFIEELVDDTASIKEIEVRFVSDAVLPKRRLVSKRDSSDVPHSTSGGAEREPGGK